MLRSAASPGSVGFGRFGSGTSGLLMTPLPTGHLRSATQKDTRKGNRCKGRPLGALVIGGARWAPLSLVAPAGRPCHWWLIGRHERYLIFASRNSTCFLATGSYFFLVSLSVMVREFLRVT